MEAATVQPSAKANSAVQTKASVPQAKETAADGKVPKGAFTLLLSGLIQADDDNKKSGEQPLPAMFMAILQQLGTLTAEQIKMLSALTKDQAQTAKGLTEGLLQQLDGGGTQQTAEKLLEQLQGLLKSAKAHEVKPASGQNIQEFAVLVRKLEAMEKQLAALKDQLAVQKPEAQEKLQTALKNTGQMLKTDTAVAKIAPAVNWQTAVKPQVSQNTGGQQPQVPVHFQQQQPALTQAAAPKSNPPPAGRVNAANIMEQLVAKLTLTAAQDQKEAAVRLKPDFLGKVQFKLTVLNDGLMTARFLVENQHVAEMLKQNIMQLRQELQSQGMNLQQVNVEVGGNWLRDQSPPQGRQNQGGNARFYGTKGGAAPEETPEIKAYGRYAVDILA